MPGANTEIFSEVFQSLTRPVYTPVFEAVFHENREFPFEAKAYVQDGIHLDVPSSRQANRHQLQAGYHGRASSVRFNFATTEVQP